MWGGNGRNRYLPTLKSSSLIDEPAKSRKTPSTVIPAEAEIQLSQMVPDGLNSDFIGMTTFYGIATY